ncbi:hypothetical protein FQR65_LT13006 [Abscondita terminalis]|nr:hypothetical protein FQR65_LT13006 [Abscondita terminalis]
MKLPQEVKKKIEEHVKEIIKLYNNTASNDVDAPLLTDESFEMRENEKCIIASDVRKEGYAKKTAQLIEDLENSLGRSKLSYKQVELFALQIYTEDFKFIVFRSFPLDWTLLHSLAWQPILSSFINLAIWRKSSLYK